MNENNKIGVSEEYSLDEILAEYEAQKRENSKQPAQVNDELDAVLSNLEITQDEIVDATFKELNRANSDKVVIQKYPTDPGKATIITVVKRYGRTHSKIPTIIVTAALAISAFSVKNNIENIPVDDGLHLKNKIEYTLESGEHIKTFETEQDVIDRYRQSQIGDVIEVPIGKVVHKESIYDKYNDPFETGNISQLNNTIDQVAVIYDGKAHSYTLDDINSQNYSSDDKTIEGIVNEELKNSDKTIDDVEIAVHFGIGWINLSDITKDASLRKENGVSFQVDSDKDITKKSKIAEDGTVSFKDDGRDVTIKITDDNNVLLKEDSIVTGSNGQEYRISSLNYDGSMLTWNMHNIKLEVALIILALGAIGNLATLKKYTEETAPKMKLSEAELNEIIYNCHKRFKHETAFNKAVEKLLNIDSASISEDITHQDLLRDAFLEKDISYSDIDKMQESSGRRM